MTVSIIIPYYNEPTLLQLLEKVLSVEAPDDISFEIIVIDDGSTDETTSALKKNKQLMSMIIFEEHKINKGKGAAIKTGIRLSTGDVIIIQDADLEYNPEDILKVIQPVISGECQVCYGSRHLDRKQIRKNLKWFRKNTKQTLLPYLGGRLITAVCSVLFFIRLTDVLTCYKAFIKDMIKDMELKHDGFCMEGELTSKLLKKTRIHEIPVNYSPRSIEEGKKIVLKDGFKIMFNIIKYRFVK